MNSISDKLPTAPAFAQHAEETPAPRYIPLRYTIMLAFLLLVIPILLAISLFSYLDARDDMNDAWRLSQEQTEDNILNSIKLINSGYQVLENALSQEMLEPFALFEQHYVDAGRDPKQMDLTALKARLEGRMDLYVISADGVIEHTTYESDLGLDFKQFPSYYARIQRILQKGEFAIDGLKSEARTGQLRMFAFMPSSDRRYLFELGMKADEFSELIGELDLLNIAQNLSNLNPSLESVRIFSPNGSLLSDPSFKVSHELKQRITDIYEQRKTLELRAPDGQRYFRYIYADHVDQDSLNDRSKIVELVYNTELITHALARKSQFYVVISVVAIILTIISTFVLAAWITGPVKKIVESVNVIAQGNLEHPIKHINAKNELKILKQSIMLMVDNMRDYINQIEQQNDELKELDKLKDDFLSNTSHELRTPVNGIIGIADSMAAGATGQLPERATENLNMIVMSGKRLSNLINDILDFSKLKHKSLELECKALEVKVIVDVVLTLSRPLLGGKPVQLVNNMQVNPMVSADENRLQQILYNLIGNAVKFTETGKIEIYSQIQDDMLAIIISDTGIGIPHDKQSVIFNSFEQAYGASDRQYGGTGLGLSITRQLVELHGGEITLTSEPGKGTDVTFTLPLAVKSQENMEITQRLDVNTIQTMRDFVNVETLEAIGESESAPSTILEASPEGLGAMSLATVSDSDDEPLDVLIVDDDPINLQVLENLLLLERYRITRANNGHQALEEINSGKIFAIVLLDLMMPKMSGYEVCRIIRETRPASELPVIMLTAKNQVSDLVEGLQAGANDYLTKPFSRNELATRIKTHVQLARITIAYSHFVPHEFLRLLEKESIIDVKLGDHVQKQMTVLFVDIRSFTTLSEKMTPKENFEFINAYLGRVSPVIRDYNGFIDKYIGDAIMALFHRSPDDGVRAALEIKRQLAEFNETRRQRGLQAISIGIGLHTGTLMLGTIGERKRMEGTVISDAVNLASRLEGLTKLYGASIVVSEQLLDSLNNPEDYEYRFLGRVRVKGKKASVRIFEIISPDATGVDAHKMQYKREFQTAIEAYYSRRFNEAASLFRRILIDSGGDKAASLYLERSVHYSKQKLPADWDGIEAMTEK